MHFILYQLCHEIHWPIKHIFIGSSSIVMNISQSKFPTKAIVWQLPYIISTSFAEFNRFFSLVISESAATAAVDKAATTLSAPHLPQQQTQAQQHWPPTLELRDFNVRYSITVPPLQFWNSEFRNKQPAHVRFNFTVPWGGNFAVYGRRNVSPSITQFDFMRYVRGGRVDHTQKRRRRSSNEGDLEESTSIESHSINRNADYRQTGSKTDVLNSILQSYDGTDRILSDGDRKGPFYVPPHDPIVMSPDNNDDKFSREFHAAEPRPTVDLQFTIDEHIIAKRAISESSMSNVSILHYLDTGRWFLSVYNDELQPYDIELIVSEVEGNPCPNDCSGHGSCYLGKCDCIDGFQGDDCSKSKLPHLSIDFFCFKFALNFARSVIRTSMVLYRFTSTRLVSISI